MVRRVAGLGLLAIGLLAAVVPYRDGVTLELGQHGSVRAAASCHSPFRGAFEARSDGGWLAFGASLTVGGGGLLVLDRRRPSRPETPPADAPS